MKQSLVIIIMLISIPSLASCSNTKKEALKVAISDQELFSKYLQKFSQQSLPISLDRKEVIALARNEYNDNPLPDLEKSRFIRFIPEELLTSYPRSKFRSFILLPGLDSLSSVILVQDIIREDLQILMRVFLITYSGDGRIIDYEELAGYNTDIWEAFMKIDVEFKIERKLYMHKIQSDGYQSNLLHLLETSSKYNLNEEGKINKISQSERLGYFEGDWIGYKFVRESE